MLMRRLKVVMSDLVSFGGAMVVVDLRVQASDGV